MTNPQTHLRDELRLCRPIIGSWLQTGAPAAAEILANAGFAWLGLDCEHTSADIALVETMARTLHGRATALLVRVSRCDPLEIRKCLDVGASGVIVPLVDNAEQAKTAVMAAKYPPLGRRGFCFGRMNDWGRQFDHYASHANEQTIVIAMIESQAGVENIDEILAVDGLDGIFIGPYDLSGSYGLPGQVEHPTVIAAKDKVLDACRRAKKAAGQHLVRSNPGQLGLALAEGYSFICLDADIIFLDQAATRALASLRLK